MVSLELSDDEALVLYEILARFDKEEKIEIQHQAEETTLWNLLALLEKCLVEPFDANYAALLNQAQERLQNDPEE